MILDGMTWVTFSLLVSAVLISILRSTLNQRTTIGKFLNSVVPSHRLLFVTPFVLPFYVRMRFQGQDLPIARGVLLNSVSMTIIPHVENRSATDTDVLTQRRYPTVKPV